MEGAHTWQPMISPAPRHAPSVARASDPPSPASAAPEGAAVSFPHDSPDRVAHAGDPHGAWGAHFNTTREVHHVMSLESLGWNAGWNERFNEYHLQGCEPRRVSGQDR